nr:hypothetical protein [Candidatus Pantoea persica]
MRQHGRTSEMLHKTLPLIFHMSQYLTLCAGDTLEVSLAGHGISTRVL